MSERLEQMRKLVAEAIETTSHCGGYCVEDGMEPCDGLNGCDECLVEAADSVLAALNRAGFIAAARSTGTDTPTEGDAHE